MILCIGEILADMVCEQRNGDVIYKRCVGGAAFNVACAVKKCGGAIGFYGRVGDDSIGRALLASAEKKGFDRLLLPVDSERNTTLAFVDLNEEGDRSFTFYRKRTADFHLLFDEVRAEIVRADIVHLGSLMLSEEEGRVFAEAVYEEVKRQKKLLSFDVNYRDDIYKDSAFSAQISRKYIERADIVKLSEEEIGMFSSLGNPTEALSELSAQGKLVVLTQGKAGATYFYNGKCEQVNTVSVRPVDTTGAGDAFFGALLAKIDADGFKNLTESIRFANVCGALTATRSGSAEAVPTREEIETYL